MPFQDLPNHIARSYVMGELLWGTDFQQYFHIGTMFFDPYALGDLFLALLVRLFSPSTAGMIWVTLSFLSLPVGLWFYLQVRDDLNRPRGIVLLLSLYLATNWFFLSGFLNYSIGLGLVFFTLGYWEKALRAHKWKPYLAYSLLLYISYCFHFAAFFFLGIVVVTVAVIRFYSNRAKLQEMLGSFLPLAILATLYLSRRWHQSDDIHAWSFRTPLDKALAFGTMYIRFNYLADIALLCAVLAIALFLLLSEKGSWRTRARDSTTIELIAVILVLFVTFMMLPVATATVYDVDNRALPFLSMFFMLLVGYVSNVLPSRRWIVTGAVMTIVVCNGVYVYSHLLKHNRFLAEYDKLIPEIPPGKVLLPVATRPAEGRVATGIHQGLLYTVYGKGLTPYIFNRTGGEFNYFRYKNLPYAPSLFWYLRGGEVDWLRVRNIYNYIIIAKPFNPSKLDLTGWHPLLVNDAAVVFENNALEK
jgi:hypothetical protein